MGSNYFESTNYYIDRTKNVHVYKCVCEVRHFELNWILDTKNLFGDIGRQWYSLYLFSLASPCIPRPRTKNPAPLLCKQLCFSSLCFCLHRKTVLNTMSRIFWQIYYSTFESNKLKLNKWKMKNSRELNKVFFQGTTQ